MKKRRVAKQLVFKFHLWVGMTIGIIVLIVSLSGALYVFKNEVQNLLRSKVMHHGEEGIDSKIILPLHEMKKSVNKQLEEEYPISWITIPMDKTQSYKFYYFERTPHAWNYFDEYIIYKCAYVNPYSGKVLKVYDEKNGFFNIIKFIHWSLLLKSSWGKYVVGIPVLLFFLMIITGIILWFPKTKKSLKARIWFRWKNVKSWRRKQYDLHSILGVYASVMALIFSITGVFYSFRFIQILIYFIFSGGNMEYPFFDEIKATAPAELRTEYTLDRVAETVEKHYPNAHSYNLTLEKYGSGERTNGKLYVSVKEQKYTYYRNHLLLFDKNSGELLKIHDHKDKNLGEKAIAANYDIHVGGIFGLPSKIFAFLMSLLCASLPVTGFLMWKEKRKRRNRQP